MKKIIATVSLTLLVTAMFMMGLVSAENETIEPGINNELGNSGLKPGSVFYGLDIAAERVRMAFTFDKQKKAEYGLEIAEERLAEAKELSEKGNREKSDVAVKNHGKAMDEVQKNIQKMNSNGDNESSRNILNATYSLEERLQIHRQKVARVHSGILDRLRNESNMSEEQIQHLEEVFGRIENHSLEVGQKISQKRENSRMRYKAFSEKSDEEIDGEFAQQRNRVREIENSMSGRVKQNIGNSNKRALKNEQNVASMPIDAEKDEGMSEQQNSQENTPPGPPK